MPLPVPPGPYLRGALWGVILPFQLMCCSLIFIKDHFVETTFITGSSMSPTLSPNFATTKAQDAILWKMWKATRNLQRGDIVHFHQPHNPEGTAVKRIIGLGGDTVVLDPKRRPKDVENSRVNPAAKKWDVWDGRVKVPEGHVWVEGDGKKTRDSNEYGPISESLILGKAVWLVWPLGQVGGRPLWEGYRSRTKVVKGEWERSKPMGWEEDMQAQVERILDG